MASADADSESASTTEPAARCGDGVVQDGEECDDAWENDDAAPCTSTCKANICGDGLVLADVEECDDGRDRERRP